MHETALVQGVVDAVGEAARQSGGRVKSFEVRVGELAQFNIGLIRELLNDLKTGTELEGAKIAVKRERTKVRCQSCKSEWSFDDLVSGLSSEEREVIHFLPELMSSYCRCPSCSKSYFEIIRGRSVTVEKVVLDV